MGQQPSFGRGVSPATWKSAAGVGFSADPLLLWVQESLELSSSWAPGVRGILDMQTIESAEDKTARFPVRKTFFSDCSDIIRRCVAVCGQEGEIQAAMCFQMISNDSYRLNAR